MILIAHRGNINGPNPHNENRPEYILNTINKGYYVEIDIWYEDNKLYLGHDDTQYKINDDFLLSIQEKIFCHCKNIKALNYIIENYPQIECFFHDTDDCVLTSKNHIWTYTGKELTTNSISVMPEKVNQVPYNCYGVCSDYVINYIKS